MQHMMLLAGEDEEPTDMVEASRGLLLTCYLLNAFKLIGFRSGCFSHIDWVVPGLGTCGAVESLTGPG